MLAVLGIFLISLPFSLNFSHFGGWAGCWRWGRCLNQDFRDWGSRIGGLPLGVRDFFDFLDISGHFRTFWLAGRVQFVV